MSRDFSAGFLPRYAVGIFPGKDPAGKTGHLGGDPGERRESWQDPGTYFTRVRFDVRFSSSRAEIASNAGFMIDRRLDGNLHPRESPQYSSSQC